MADDAAPLLEGLPATAEAAAADALITGENHAPRSLPPEPPPTPADEETAEAARQIVPREAEETAKLVLGDEDEEVDLITGESVDDLAIDLPTS